MISADDYERLAELWLGRLRATTDFEAGYYQGRFEEYADQNAIDPEGFSAIRMTADLRRQGLACDPAPSRRVATPAEPARDDREPGVRCVAGELRYSAAWL